MEDDILEELLAATDEVDSDCRDESSLIDGSLFEQAGSINNISDMVSESNIVFVDFIVFPRFFCQSQEIISDFPVSKKKTCGQFSLQVFDNDK